MNIELSQREQVHLTNILKRELAQISDWHFAPTWDVPPITKEQVLHTELLLAKVEGRPPQDYDEIRVAWLKGE